MQNTAVIKSTGAANTANTAGATGATSAANVRYSYFDCLRDEVPIPSGPSGSALYHMLAVGSMTLLLFAVTCLGRRGTGYFTYTH